MPIGRPGATSLSAGAKRSQPDLASRFSGRAGVGVRPPPQEKRTQLGLGFWAARAGRARTARGKTNPPRPPGRGCIEWCNATLVRAIGVGNLEGVAERTNPTARCGSTRGGPVDTNAPRIVSLCGAILSRVSGKFRRPLPDLPPPYLWEEPPRPGSSFRARRAKGWPRDRRRATRNAGFQGRGADQATRLRLTGGAGGGVQEK